MVRLTDLQISGALSQYKELVDQTYDMFAVDCEIHYSKQKTSTSIDVNNNIPDLNSVNARRKHPLPDVYDNGNTTVTTVEVKENISIKIYWNAKDWKTVYGYTTVPDNHVMFLAKSENANKLNSAVKVVFTDENSISHTFTRVSMAVPYGLDKKKDYCSSIWAQI